MQNNLLEELPPEIGSLHKLQVINLSDNKLENLPPQFYMLEELHELYLKNNHINILESEIGNLIMLTSMVIYIYICISFDCIFNYTKLIFLKDNYIYTCVFRIYHIII